jgi:hypothetical protein
VAGNVISDTARSYTYDGAGLLTDLSEGPEQRAYASRRRSIVPYVRPTWC